LNYSGKRHCPAEIFSNVNHEAADLGGSWEMAQRVSARSMLRHPSFKGIREREDDVMIFTLSGSHE
jgi:hypothetical protein